MLYAIQNRLQKFIDCLIDLFERLIVSYRPSDLVFSDLLDRHSKSDPEYVEQYAYLIIRERFEARFERSDPFPSPALRPQTCFRPPEGIFRLHGRAHRSGLFRLWHVENRLSHRASVRKENKRTNRRDGASR
jgi:hypothetical protein